MVVPDWYSDFKTMLNMVADWSCKICPPPADFSPLVHSAMQKKKKENKTSVMGEQVDCVREHVQSIPQKHYRWMSTKGAEPGCAVGKRKHC